MAALLLGAATAWAGLPRACDPRRDVTAAQQDRLLRFAAIVRQVLTESGRLPR